MALCFLLVKRRKKFSQNLVLIFILCFYITRTKSKDSLGLEDDPLDNNEENDSMDIYRDSLQEDYQVGFVQLMELFGNLNATLEKINYKIGFLEEKLESSNIPPIGFVYIQYGDQDEPSKLWPLATWINVSGNYSGTFFRAEGGDSKSFGQSQGQHLPTLQFQYKECIGSGYTNNNLNFGGSATVNTGGYRGCWTGLRVSYEGGKVRPDNQAVRIWKRAE